MKTKNKIKAKKGFQKMITKGEILKLKQKS